MSKMQDYIEQQRDASTRALMPRRDAQVRVRSADWPWFTAEVIDAERPAVQLLRLYSPHDSQAQTYRDATAAWFAIPPSARTLATVMTWFPGVLTGSVFTDTVYDPLVGLAGGTVDGADLFTTVANTLPRVFTAAYVDIGDYDGAVTLETTVCDPDGKVVDCERVTRRWVDGNYHALRTPIWLQAPWRIRFLAWPVTVRRPTRHTLFPVVVRELTLEPVVPTKLRDL